MCDFCPDKGGLIANVIYQKNHKRSKKQNLNNYVSGWAHPTCINYIKSIWFTNANNSHVTGEVNGAIKFKFQENEENIVKRPCSICDQESNVHGMIQCDRANCKTEFHVRCAIKEGMITDWQEMGSRDMKVFCNDHFIIKNGAVSCKKINKSPAKFADEMKKIVSLEEELRLFDSRPIANLKKQVKQNKVIVKKPKIDKFNLG